MPYKSKLYQRNNGGFSVGRTQTARKPYPARAARTYPGRIYPRPSTTAVSKVNTREIKEVTQTDMFLALRLSSQVQHVDIIGQGVGAANRTGQKHRVTGVHLKGHWQMPSQDNYDIVGYQLVWDRSPNQALPVAQDILTWSVDSSRGFPNTENQDRFVFLGKKTHKAVIGTSTGTSSVWAATNSAMWEVDDYYDFSDKQLIGTNIFDGTGAIGDRTSGALYIVGTGQQASANANNLTFDARVYFEDV